MQGGRRSSPISFRRFWPTLAGANSQARARANGLIDLAEEMEIGGDRRRGLSIAAFRRGPDPADSSRWRRT